MGNVANAFSLPFKSPDWFPRLLVIGLITLIPVIGWMNTTGWMLATLDNYRRGVVELPPAGFQYIGRGAALFLVGLVYVVVIAVIFVVPVVLVAIGSAASSSSNGFAASGLNTTSTGLGQVVSLAAYVFLPAVVINTDRHGIAGGLNVGEVWRMTSSNWKNSLIAAILIYAAGYVGALGLVACCVGFLVTYPYSVAVIAGIIRYYEATFEPPQQVLQPY